MLHNKYNVKPTDLFDGNFYPEITTDLEEIRILMISNSSHLNPNILISYVKHHSMQTAWTEQHPEIEKLICSGSLLTKNLEALFASSTGNIPFQTRLEAYITRWFNPAVSAF